MAKTPSKADLASELEGEAARLAGVVEILENIGEVSGVADSLGVLRDVVDEVNAAISDVAQALRTVR
jgi:hypothetical protein